MKTRAHQETFDRWLNCHTGLLLKVASSFSKDATDRDDLLQEISFQVWKSIPGYDGRVKESTWIYRVSLYTAIRWAKRESNRPSTANLEQPAIVIDQSGQDPRLAWLYEQIQALEPIDRSLTLLMLDGYSYLEIADTLGMTESNVGVRLSRIKKDLTRKLQRERNDDIR
ncbi:RNA polymerase sigma factor [Rhodopirellula sp. MGV]|uniref:RNA polymerase sigma factor n=1 Tax=Rhodopirellula sp. MGV TaxID=2023130 RepID=UPI000B97B258|nr:sigma-70 family RNA polymerase sigma factor [Rhodopirellula sp. MGV]OYP36730.1 hypothetical protein CGZ80_07460 [Rhodopirellula sp. MGV]PNY34423.1 sigma-70 family RNA polymerase sigma factor [Rhodopirellula baltica]